MKQKLLTIKSLLVAVLLLGGANFVWAESLDDYGVDLDLYDKTTYDFTAMSGSLTIDKTAAPYSVWSTKANSYKGGTMDVYPCTTTGLTRFAFEEVGGDAWGFISTNGLANVTRVYSAAVTGLKNGNIVVFVYTMPGKVNFGNTAANVGPYTLGEEVTVTAQTTIYDGRYYKKATMTADGVIGFDMNKYPASANAGFMRQIHVYTAKGSCAEPEYQITGANNNKRTFELSCSTDGATIYYSTSELATATGGIEYTDAVETEATTIWAYASKGGSKSNVINFATGAGSTLTLNAPTFTKTGYSSNNFIVSISSNQASVVGAPVPTYYYRIGTAGDFTAYSDPVSVPEGSTIYAYAAKAGYANSTNASLATSVMPAFVEVWSTDFTGLASADYTATTFGSTYYVLENVNSNFGAAPVESANKYYIHNGGLYVFYGGGRTFAINNLKEGDYIRITSSIATTANSGVTLQENLSYGNVCIYKATADGIGIFNTPRYNVIYKVEVLKHVVPATIGSTGYTTFASSYPLNIDGMTASTGTVKAYYVTASDVKSSSVALTEVTGNVEAGTGLILEGTDGAAITIPVVASGTDLSSTNMLVGCTTATDITSATENYGNFYVLSANEAAFKKIKTWVDAPNTLTIPAGKAYLDTTGADVVGAPTLTFDLGGVTAITNTNCTNNTNIREVYNLNGQRVAQPTKGLYIVNGKKIIIK